MATFRKLVSKCLVAGLLACAVHGEEASPAIPYAEDFFPALRPILQSATANAAGLQINRLKIRETRSDRQAARAERLPTARLHGRLIGSYETRDDIGDSFTGDVDANLTVAQPLYHWGQLEKRQRIADYRLDQQEYWQSKDWHRQLLQLRQAFLQWILTHRKEAILQQSISTTETMLEAYQQLLESGRSSRGDLLEMEARLLETSESLAFARKQLHSAQRDLVRLSGSEPDWETLAATRLQSIKPLSDSKLDAVFLDCRQRFQQQTADSSDPRRLQEQIERRRLEILDREHWPKLDFVAGIFSDQLEAVNQSESVIRLRYFAGIRVNWNLFDGWQTRARKQAALARLRSSQWEQQASDARETNQLENLLAQVRLHQKQIKARAKRLDLLQQRVQLLRQQADTGRVSGTDLMEREVDLMELRQRVMEARVAYLNAFMRTGLLLGDARFPAPWLSPDS